MKEIAISILAFSCCLCAAQVNDNDDKTHQCSASCCNTHSLLSFTQSLGAMGEKVANMAEKIPLLENKLRMIEMDMLELLNRIRGNISQWFHDYSLHQFLLLTCLCFLFVALRDTSGGLLCNAL